MRISFFFIWDKGKATAISLLLSKIMNIQSWGRGRVCGQPYAVVVRRDHNIIRE